MNATISAFSSCANDVDTRGATLQRAHGPHPQIVIGSRVSSTAGVVSGGETFDAAVTGMASRALRVNFKAALSCSLPTSTERPLVNSAAGKSGRKTSRRSGVGG